MVGVSNGAVSLEEFVSGLSPVEMIVFPLGGDRPCNLVKVAAQRKLFFNDNLPEGIPASYLVESEGNYYLLLPFTPELGVRTSCALENELYNIRERNALLSIIEAGLELLKGKYEMDLPIRREIEYYAPGSKRINSPERFIYHPYLEASCPCHLGRNE